MAKTVLHIVTKDEKNPHVRDEVKNSRMSKHGGEQAVDLMRAELVQEMVRSQTAHIVEMLQIVRADVDLQVEDQEIQNNENRVDDWKASGWIVVFQRKHGD